MLEKILKRADTKEFLHEMLLDFRFNDKKSPPTKEGGNYPKSEYSLILVMDAFIKYAILFDTDDLVDEYIAQLRRFMKKCEDHRDFIKGVHRLLGRITATLLKIDLEEIEQIENKKRILFYIYDHYITNGYVFYTFPDIYAKWVMENGIDALDYSANITKLKEVKEIFLRHNRKDILQKDLGDTSYFTITDSPALAYHQALHSPSYLSELTSMSIYMDNEKKYDIGAYFRKDFKKAEENIIQLCRELELSNSEATVVLESFVQEWRRLNITTSAPVIAFIKRKSVDHHYLKDYRKILDMCDKEDLSYLIGQIMESRIDDEKRYTPIDNEQVKIVTLPGWSQIYCDTGDFIEEKEEQVEPVAEKMPERVTVRNEVVNTYENASIVALFGVLLIALGATITILLAIYKG